MNSNDPWFKSCWGPLLHLSLSLFLVISTLSLSNKGRKYAPKKVIIQTVCSPADWFRTRGESSIPNWLVSVMYHISASAPYRLQSSLQPQTEQKTSWWYLCLYCLTSNGAKHVTFVLMVALEDRSWITKIWMVHSLRSRKEIRDNNLTRNST